METHAQHNRYSITSSDSVAAGPAELVGQVRPGPQGTLSVDVGGSSRRRVQGVVNYRWKEEERVCSKDSDGKESCKWVTRRTDQGGCEFILHDGTGGILVDPTTWEKVNMGGRLFKWGTSNWRWTVWVLAAGDPVYCLGRVETRTHDEREEGIDTTIPNSLLVVRGNKDIRCKCIFTEALIIFNRWITLNHRGDCCTASDAGIQCTSIHLVINLRLHQLLQSHRLLHHQRSRSQLFLFCHLSSSCLIQALRLHAFPLQSP